MDGSGGLLDSGGGEADGQADNVGGYRPQLGSAGRLALGSGRCIDHFARAGKLS